MTIQLPEEMFAAGARITSIALGAASRAGEMIPVTELGSSDHPGLSAAIKHILDMSRQEVDKGIAALSAVTKEGRTPDFAIPSLNFAMTEVGSGSVAPSSTPAPGKTGPAGAVKS